jgi:hypothetical protein
MAEAFGAAAGVFGVVSLSIQLAESIQKVKSFRANFKHACPRLADLVEEIAETYDLMKDLEYQSEDTGATASLLMCRCINSSRRAVEYFAKVTSELEIYAKRNRIRGGLKFALSQDEIARMLSRMERAKGILAIAYMQHLRAVQQQQYDMMMQGIERLALGQNDILQRMKPAAGVHQIVCTNDVVAKTDRKNFRRIFEVRTPEWMNDKIWQLALDRSICGWQFTMRTYGVVPRNAPIIKACQGGNTVAMQRLFDTGAASPFDQTLEGYELAWVSHYSSS